MIIVLTNKIIDVINDPTVKDVNCESDNINDKKNQEIAPRICKIAEETLKLILSYIAKTSAGNATNIIIMMFRVNKYGCSKVTVFGPVGCMAAKNKQTIVDKIDKIIKVIRTFIMTILCL
ncbi:hypothetical protein SA19103_10490 [Staphylococcus argenteus]|nr:hypothetical protein SA19103_10490 [Staphylococcus argenteus]